jgi:hypothetical protein
MSNSSRIGIDFIVVSALFYIKNRLFQMRRAHLIGLVPEEMDFLKTFVLDVLQGISFVPTVGESVKGYLTSDGVCQAVIWKLFLKSLHESSPVSVFLEER